MELRALLLHMHYYGPVGPHGEPTSYKEPVEKAYQSFQRWRSANRVPSSQKKFNFWMVFKDEYGTYLNSKGYQARVLSAWLQHELEDAHRNRPANLLHDESLYLSLVALTPGKTITGTCFLGWKCWPSTATIFKPLRCP